jgi:hypothetical protein
LPLTPQQQAILDRGRRLMDLRGQPGFSDLLTISEKLAQEAETQMLRYEGWDKDQLLGLQKRADGARGHHQRLLAVMEETMQIAADYSLTREYHEPEKTLSEEERDQMRESFLAGVE